MKYISAFQMISGMSFANDFSIQAYNNKEELQKKQSADISHIGIYWRGSYIFYKWACAQTNP